MKGLGYIKGQDAPLAKEDKDYPEWLWGLLKPGEKGSDADGAVGDAFGESRTSTTYLICTMELGVLYLLSRLQASYRACAPIELSTTIAYSCRRCGTMLVAPTNHPLIAKSKKQRRLASKAARALKTGSNGANHVVKVPLEEQSIDLPAGMGLYESMEAQEAREELNGAMRKARRRRIKEANFLRGMR